MSNPIEPIEPNMPTREFDPVGKAHEAKTRELELSLTNNPRRDIIVVSDGYAWAIMVKGQFWVRDEYKGTDGMRYERMRPANEFETHMLRKIAGLNRFFVE